MKLQKIKIARLTEHQAKSIVGGGTNGSTRKNFTCCWCSSGDDPNLTGIDPNPITNPNDPTKIVGTCS